MEAMTFETLGTVAQFIGNKGAVGRTNENLLKEDVNVQLPLRGNDGTVIKANLSPALSRMLRSKQITLGTIPTLILSKRQDGVYFINREQSEIIWTEAKDLNIRELVTVEVSQEDLIAL